MNPVLLLPLLGGSLFALYGLYRLVQVIRLSHRISAGASWPVTSGTVTESRVMHHGTNARGGRHFWAEIRYAYSVFGSEYGAACKVDTFWGSEAAAQRDAGKFPVGSALPVHYNPEKPQEAFTPYDRVSSYELVVAVFFLCTGILVGCPAFLGLIPAL